MLDLSTTTLTTLGAGKGGPRKFTERRRKRTDCPIRLALVQGFSQTSRVSTPRWRKSELKSFHQEERWNIDFFVGHSGRLREREVREKREKGSSFFAHRETSRMRYPKPVRPVLDDCCLAYLRAIVRSHILRISPFVNLLLRQLSFKGAH